jgi:hypothetical protein
MPRLQPGHHGHAGAAGVLQLEAGAEAVGPRGADLAVAGSPLDGAARVRLTAASPPPMISSLKRCGVQLNRRGVQVEWDGHGACRVHVSGWGQPRMAPVLSASAWVMLAWGVVGARHQQRVTADTEKRPLPRLTLGESASRIVSVRRSIIAIWRTKPSPATVVLSTTVAHDLLRSFFNWFE